jgi:hypothetical protein
MASNETLEQKTFYPDYHPASEGGPNKRSKMLSYTAVSLLASIATAAVIVGTYYARPHVFPKDDLVVASHQPLQQVKPLDVITEKRTEGPDPQYTESPSAAPLPPLEKDEIIPDVADTIPEKGASPVPSSIGEVAVIPEKNAPDQEETSPPAPQPSLEEVAAIPEKESPAAPVFSGKDAVDVETVEMNTLARTTTSNLAEVYHKSPNPYLKKKSPGVMVSSGSQDLHLKPYVDEEQSIAALNDRVIGAPSEYWTADDPQKQYPAQGQESDYVFNLDPEGWNPDNQSEYSSAEKGWEVIGGDRGTWASDGLDAEVVGETPPILGADDEDPDSLIRNGWIDEQQRHAVVSQNIPPSNPPPLPLGNQYGLPPGGLNHILQQQRHAIPSQLPNNPTGLEFGGQNGLPPGVLYHILEQQRQF